MPRRCCVPGCKSNYLTSIRSRGPVTMFKFPKDEDLRNKWIRAIHRTDLAPTDNTGVCAIHFKPEDFRHSDKGVTRKRPRLRENVIPSIFPTLFNMSSCPSARRRDPAIRRLKRAFARKNQKYLHIEADRIKTFENFLENFSEKLDLTNWHVLKNDMKVVFYRVVLTEDTGCEICTRIIVTKDLHLKVILGQLELRFKDLQWVLRSSLKLVLWSQVAKVLSRYLNVEAVPSQNRDYYLERALNFLNIANEYDFKYSSYIEVLCNQIALIKKSKKKRYDVPALNLAFMIYSQSIPAYENLRKFLIMPCRRYLQSISSTAIQNNKTYSIDEMYIERIIDNLEIRDRYVALLLYAINAGVDAFDPTITKTLIVFMIKSLYGTFKKVVRLVPISNPSGSDLKHLTIETITFVESLSFKICVVTTDNNKINQSLFKLLTENQSDKSFCNYFINPGNSEEIIYLQYDTIQIYKNIRNDWISLPDSGQTFFYPDFETGEVKSASFLHLKNIFSEEIDLPDKQAFKLNIKTLQPNGIERQNLALVENVFHPSTILALKQREGDMAETGEFCSIIRKWWDIMNVKGTLFLNYQNTDEDKSPFCSSNDARIEFLDKFTSWLELWSSTEESGNGGILARDTSNAAILTTKTVIDLIKYSFDDLQIDYILPSMLQTDDLEVHLRSYRGIEGQCILSYHTKYEKGDESSER